MKSEKEIKEKIKQMEEYIEKGIAMTKIYPLENSKNFLAGIKWVLGEQ